MNDAKPSKSALKRESLALQSLGEKLMQLTQAELETLQLDSPLFKAIVDAKRIRSHGALRRQRQLIGKLMRTADAAGIESSLEALAGQSRRAKTVFHTAEAWRNRLCAEGAPALQAFAELTGRDPGRLRELLREQGAATHDAALRAVRRRVFRQVYEELIGMNSEPRHADSETAQ